MKTLPHTENPVVLRTDFSDQARWENICEEIRKPVQQPLGLGYFQAFVECIDERIYQNLTTDQLLKITAEAYQHSFIILADKQTITSPDALLLVVDLWDEPGRAFRTPPNQIQGIENNLSISNMDFYEFADNVDENGVFTGFSDFFG